MQKNRAAIYARFSSHNQRSESIEIQVDNSRAFCERSCTFGLESSLSFGANLLTLPVRSCNFGRAYLFSLPKQYKSCKI